MTVDQDVEVLRGIPMFATIECKKLKLLAMQSDRVLYKPGQDLCRQGEPGDSAFVLISGTADVLVDTPNGPLKVATLPQNAILGEIAILCDVPRTATVRAAEELAALEITKDVFFRMVEDYPDFGIAVMRVLAQRLEQTTAQLREAQSS